MPPLLDRPHLRSYICADWELRITRRCIEEDLAGDPEADFESMLSHPIVKAFCNKRSKKSIDTKKIEPLTTGRTIYRLAHQHRHRGATWYDTGYRVIWLCAYGHHESGSEGDAFPYFKRLDAEDRLLPTEGDYKTFIADRNQRFADTVVIEAQDLLDIAQEEAGVEQRGTLGQKTGVGVVVEIVETLEETSIAITIDSLPPGWLDTILAAFDPNLTYNDWELTDKFPTRALKPNEICYRHLKETR